MSLKLPFINKSSISGRWVNGFCVEFFSLLFSFSFFCVSSESDWDHWNRPVSSSCLSQRRLIDWRFLSLSSFFFCLLDSADEQKKAIEGIISAAANASLSPTSSSSAAVFSPWRKEAQQIAPVSWWSWDEAFLGKEKEYKKMTSNPIFPFVLHFLLLLAVPLPFFVILVRSLTSWTVFSLAFSCILLSLPLHFVFPPFLLCRRIWRASKAKLHFWLALSLLVLLSLLLLDLSLRQRKRLLPLWTHRSTALFFALADEPKRPMSLLSLNLASRATHHRNHCHNRKMARWWQWLRL